MPVVYPAVPAAEMTPKARILKKYSEYMYELNRGDVVQSAARTTTLQGERYEIAVAVAMLQMGKFTSGNQIGRWTPNKPGLAPVVKQDVTLGGNTEYDFILPGTAAWANTPTTVKPILGEAKSYNNGLGVYIKKAITYCMHDATLGGICFVTPQNPYVFFLYMMQQVHSVLANPNANSSGIAGGASWTTQTLAGRPSGQQIQQYFHQEYGNLRDNTRIHKYQDEKASQVTHQVRRQFNVHTNQMDSEYYQRRSNKRATAQFLNQELYTNAGIVAMCHQVRTASNDELRTLVGNIP